MHKIQLRENFPFTNRIITLIGKISFTNRTITDRSKLPTTVIELFPLSVQSLKIICNNNEIY